MIIKIKVQYFTPRDSKPRFPSNQTNSSVLEHFLVLILLIGKHQISYNIRIQETKVANHLSHLHFIRQNLSFNLSTCHKLMEENKVMDFSLIIPILSKSTLFPKIKTFGYNDA